MLGSSHVIGVDVDEDALHTAQENCEQYEDLQVSAVAINLALFSHDSGIHDVIHYVV